MFQIAVVVGSLRKDSFNRRLALSLEKLKHPQLNFKLIQIDDIPLYNQDLDNHLPASVVRFKKEIAQADGILFVTPEYNRSIPGVLKNLIDWGTRPHGQNAWAGKIAAMIGISPGNIATAIAQSHLRSILVSIDMVVLGFPEVYLVYKEGLFDAQGNIAIESTRQFLQNFLNKFAGWLAKEPNPIVLS